MSNVAQIAQALVDALNAEAAALLASGARPLYRRFGLEVGRVNARIFSIDEAGSRSARAFVTPAGVFRSASWKKYDRFLGRPGAEAVRAYVLGPVFVGGAK